MITDVQLQPPPHLNSSKLGHKASEQSLRVSSFELRLIAPQQGNYFCPTVYEKVP
jgi:hypothetical protein